MPLALKEHQAPNLFLLQGRPILRGKTHALPMAVPLREADGLRITTTKPCLIRLKAWSLHLHLELMKLKPLMRNSTGGVSMGSTKYIETPGC